MTPVLKRILGTLLVAVPALTIATTPVLATTAKAKHHTVHKIIYHKSHAKKTQAPTAS